MARLAGGLFGLAPGMIAASRSTVLGLELLGREEALLQVLDLVHAHDVVQLLERDQRVGPIDDLAAVERLLEQLEAVLHALQRAGGQQARIDHHRHAEILQLFGGEKRRRRALPDAEAHVHRQRLDHVLRDRADVVGRHRRVGEQQVGAGFGIRG